MALNYYYEKENKPYRKSMDSISKDYLIFPRTTPITFEGTCTFSNEEMEYLSKINKNKRLTRKIKKNAKNNWSRKITKRS